MSTACGPLDHIVVDCVDTAQWCIEFLKKHNIGRASFIALDKQEHLRTLSDSRIITYVVFIILAIKSDSFNRGLILKQKYLRRTVVYFV